jgi:hypothetical protein
MNDRPIPEKLIPYHVYTLKNLWGGPMRWFATSRSEGKADGAIAPHEMQNARKMAEQYWDRFEQEAETLLHYMRASGAIQITGPEESTLKRHGAGHDHRL